MLLIEDERPASSKILRKLGVLYKVDPSPHSTAQAHESRCASRVTVP